MTEPNDARPNSDRNLQPVPIEPQFRPPVTQGPEAPAALISPVDSRVRLARSTLWTAFSQVAPMGATIVLTPYIIHGLGVTRYGLFILIGSLITVLASLNGGTLAGAKRYFAVHVGGGDTQAMTELLVTLLVAVSALGVLVSTAGWFLAPAILDLLVMPKNLQPQALFLLRTLGILITLSFFHSAFASMLQAHNRYAYLAKMSLLCWIIWTTGLVITVHFKYGLRGIAVVFLIQQTVLVLTTVSVGLSYADRNHIRFMRRVDLLGFMKFSWKAQIGGFVYLINTEVDNLLVGGVLSVRTVSFYDTGVNFAQNISGILATPLAPMQTMLGHTYGRDGEEETLRQFTQLQRLLAIGLAGWFAAAAGAAYFGIVSWLGPQFRIAGAIAIVALGTQMLQILNGMLTIYCETVGRPNPVFRAGLFSVAVNLVLTAAFLATGPLGVAAATLAGQVAAFLYLLRSSRREIAAELPNVLRILPLISSLITGGLVVGLELALRPVVPGGALGLLTCGSPAIVGLFAFVVLRLGPRSCLSYIDDFRKRSRADGMRTAGIGVVRLAIRTEMGKGF